MGITRKAAFGIPPAGNQGSTQTTRLVPLSTGVHQDVPWPLQQPGSATSLSNFLPIGGKLRPRSRLSSLNTIRTLPSVLGMYPNYTALGTANTVWLSSSTLHGLMASTGSISKASFVSSFGLGVGSLAANTRWQYTQVYSSALDQNMLIAAANSSVDTLLCVYPQANGGGPIYYSYLTSAPKTACVTSFDNYIVAFNILGTGSFPTRVQWCQRGNPSNWTGEGSGFEDLLDMKGTGTRAWGTAEGRILLFTDQEIWHGVGAAYPAQFQFFPLDRTVGCTAYATVQETEAGIIFFGTDSALRILPRGGGESQVLSDPVSEVLRTYAPAISKNLSWGVYDSLRRHYHFFLDSSFGGTLRGFVLNIGTGEWGFMDYNTPTPQCGTAAPAPSGAVFADNLFLGDSNGTAYSLNSTLNLENGSVVTSKWQSTPIASELPGNWKQITHVALDYRATSKSTVTLKLSQDGGNNYEATGVAMSLASAPVSGRVEQDVYRGGAFPALELTSTSTGYELHRLDVTLNLGGRR